MAGPALRHRRRRSSRCARRCTPSSLRRLDAGRVTSSAPRSPPSSRSSPAYLGVPPRRSAWPTARTPSCSPCARSASGPATTSWSPPSPSTPPPRRSRSRARDPCSATSTRTTFCVTPDTVRAALTPDTKAVIAVHLFGNVAAGARDRRARRARGGGRGAGRSAPAPPPGAPARSGRSRTLSFFPSKNLGGFGDGGAVATADDALAERLRMLRFHGSRDKQSFELVGHNSRLDELQAALLRARAPAPRLLVRGPPRRAGATTTTRASASSSRCPCPPTAPTRPGTSTSCATSAPTPWAPRSAGGHRAARPTTASPSTSSPRCGAWAPASELPGTDEAARTHLAIPMSPVLTRGAGRPQVVAAARDAGLD